MKRRVTHAILLFAGLAPAVWALCALGNDARRAAVLGALAALGLGLNGVALATSRFGVRTPLRVIACGVALVVFGSVMATWHRIRSEYLPGLPPSEHALRGTMRLAAQNLVWIAAAVVYVIVTVLILPKPARKRPAQPGQATSRIDFRRFGR